MQLNGTYSSFFFVKNGTYSSNVPRNAWMHYHMHEQFLTHQSSYIALAWRETVDSNWEACKWHKISHIEIGTLQVFAEPKRSSCCTTSWLWSCITSRTWSLCKAIEYPQQKGNMYSQRKRIHFYRSWYVHHSICQIGGIWLFRMFPVLFLAPLQFHFSSTIIRWL
jgi:hypothetical protein